VPLSTTKRPLTYKESMKQTVAEDDSAIMHCQDMTGKQQISRAYWIKDFKYFAPDGRIVPDPPRLVRMMTGEILDFLDQFLIDRT